MSNSAIPDPANPTPPLTRVKKRIIVCCDGTWEDGVTQENRQSYTNILRLARTINHEDTRFSSPIPQIVFYQSGIGSEKSFYSEYVVGRNSVGDKVEEAYGFIAHNYYPGDEIFLFGFSRGAYTARMVAMFIGKIGVLDRVDMDHFATIFLAYQKIGKSKDQNEIQQLNAQIEPWTHHESPGKIRADSDDNSFFHRFVGVFETVGSLGLPEELSHHGPDIRNLFGFNDQLLGEHIQYAYHALALNETRADFNCCKFEQSPHGLQKGQVLRQCWFAGSHADIGGGWKDHDLADITLFWMAANLEDHISLDYGYLGSLPRPGGPWGTEPPHNPLVGIYEVAKKIQRTLPMETNNVTHETIHCSVLEQKSVTPALGTDLHEHPELIVPLLPLEDALRRAWPTLPPRVKHNSSSTTVKHAMEKDTGLTMESGHRVRAKNWLGEIVQDIKSSIENL
ncbi:hypothetical protein DFH07DRAFT_726840 [Mycena maculata]|uniref:T6SS Phospholipase effector Tle1-like catalytic domain-containing protein n=1 Tax=Mycena maculata TaxID=230809 RepID=A0AAD7P1D0_9AGAR|nr:hypothetical protein DFH07DRAFT_726840 [Mycena maculata]